MQGAAHADLAKKHAAADAKNKFQATLHDEATQDMQGGARAYLEKKRAEKAAAEEALKMRQLIC